MNEPTFWFFAYGTEMSASGLTVRIRDALGSSDASSSAVVLESIPAYVQGYRLTLSAVSAEGPRYACANIFPIAKRRPCVEGAEKRQQPLDAYHLPPSADGRLYGVLHQVPEGVRAALMEAISRSGSYNVSALLPCFPADGGEDVSALVVAAMDLELAERTYELSGLSSIWKEMDGAATRWPYTHWCRCIATPRVAPSTAYLSALRNAFEECALKLSASTDYMKAYGCVMAAAATDAITPRDVAHEPKEAKVWYFAYGSNMSFEQFCVRCGPPYQRRPVRLEEWVLIPNKTPLAHHYASFGYYNIESVAVRENKASTGEVPTEDPNNGMPRYVCGAAYEISLEQLEMMDGYETGYTRELVRCEDIAEELKDAPEEVQKALAASPTVDGSYDCWAYLAIDTNETLLPSKEYVARVLEGSDILPAAYMEAIRAAPKNPLRSPRQDQRLRKEI